MRRRGEEPAPDLVVVGCPSMDRVVLSGESREILGGAGYVTALAAHVAGARVGLVSRVPRDLPAVVARTLGPGGLERRGVSLGSGRLPSFHIVYDARHSATYIAVEEGLEGSLTAADVPEAWLGARIVHVPSLAGRTDLQLRFVSELRARGFEGLVSAGTYSAAVHGERDQVAALLLLTDFFFLNAEEASLLIPGGPPRHHRGVVCVTRGSQGVEIFGGERTVAAAPAVPVVDPTCAGDSFCGGFLGATARGLEPVAAGLALAAEVLGGWGGAPLADRVASEVQPRVRVDPERVAAVGAALQDVAAGAAIDFCGAPFPEAGDPRAVEIFAAATLHQYGFWRGDESGWIEPMYAVAGGRRWKGSDFVWQAFTGAAARSPALLDPELGTADPGLFQSACADDEGRCPLPELGSHERLHAAYLDALRDRGPRAWEGILAEVAASETPLRRLLEVLAELPGYSEDPLAKKANLLAVILSARPEGFVEPGDSEAIGPIVDYHLMRGCLRTGCVLIEDPELRDRVEQRRWVDCLEEEAIRAASAEAIRGLVEASGRSMAEIDGFFFRNGRATCVELAEPGCDDCALQPSCARFTKMFQPVFRTTAY